MDNSRHAGMTLTELITALLVVSTLSAIALPALDDFFKRQLALSEVTALRQLVYQARGHAITSGVPAVLCPISANECSTNWSEGKITLFEDLDRNRKIDPNDKVLTHFQLQQANRVKLDFPRSAIVFYPSGFAQGFTGSLLYCRSTEPPITMSLIISRVGRVRHGTDSNNDGILESATGKNAPCPSA
ncbi:hypothetical protein GCM10011297_18760 [Bacterioplanes sanyensis]|uniref:GspH/FimT family pseudopilin n=1 Tax=Bacterioplanes sanyensis TaxID=1249553 RepID=UPI001678BF26|nr:GspH/FimT family pseudopilin [Bacterioplanes sanyensis]GGY46170.1 hypothetical protein GCM10011297_18760 [Bacterioplanes sanyensis]